MRKLIFILCFTHSALLLFSGNVKIKDIKDTNENAGAGDIRYKSESRNITIMNAGPVKYHFRYNYIDDPNYLKINPEAALPRIGDTTASNTGIGLTPAWYENGFIGISVNGSNVFGEVAKIDISDNSQGRVEFTWNMPDGVVKAIFIMPENGDRIFCRVDAGEVKNLKSLNLTFLALPGHRGMQKMLDRWCSTSEHNWQYLSDGAKAKDLDMKSENWILFYDSQDNPLGSAGILFDTEKLQDVQCMPGSMIIKIKISARPECHKVDFVIWGFPDNYKNPETAYDYLNENSGKILKELRNFKF